MTQIRLGTCGLVILAASTCTLSVSAADHASGGLAGGLRPFVDSHDLAGAVTLVASPEAVLAVDTVGFADIAAGKPMRAGSLFWIASMSKPVTAVALMILVDEGKVNVDDPVEKYLPEFRNSWLAVEQDKEHILLKHPARAITVKNILSHTSGLLPRSAMEQPTLDLLPLRDAVRSYAITPLEFEPGSQYQYSNAGINTAGRIVEVVSGMPFEQFLAARLFQPLGMKDTTFWPTEAQVKRLAKSYQPDAGKKGLEETKIDQVHYPLTGRNRYPFPAGGLFSTAQDMARFGQMILNTGMYGSKRILSEAAIRQMTSVQTGEIRVNNSDSTGYGFGLSVLKRAAADGRSAGSFGHGGAYKTMLWMDPQKQLVMVLMRQHAGRFRSPEGARIEPEFFKAAIAKYGK
jgi:CubicO group peptidase (beta-lactamase class C family)